MDMDDLKETIKHFTHPHPLKLVQLDGAGGYFDFTCYCCKSNISGSPRKSHRGSGRHNVMYACREPECNPHGVEVIGRFPYGAYLCVSCAQLGEIVESHALHPHHPRLKLRRSTSDAFSLSPCGACCNWMSSNFSYRCEDEKCNFEMHLKCAHSLKPTLSLPSHSHLLALVVHQYPSTLALNCEACHSVIPHPWTFARCAPCNLNYHISCLEVQYYVPGLVKDVQHHPQHPLSLVMMASYWCCDVCYKNKRDWPQTLAYACLDCNNFTAHLSCIFRSSLPCPSSNRVTNVVLPTLMTKDGPMDENWICQRCKKCILDNGVPVYGCQYCHVFLHETCISRATVVDDKVEEALIFSHPGYDLERNNPLVLVFAHGNPSFTCACCSKKCIGFMFQEREDKMFVLDLECMLVVPCSEIIGHNHPVTLLQRSNTTKGSYLRCITCCRDFDIGESRFRLPQTLLHECHLHPLTLVPCLVENLDTDQYYCDVCEDKREPNECIYYCVECKFEAQLACVKSELVALCTNKPEDAKFVTLQEIKLKEEAKKKKARVRDIFRLEEELPLSYDEVNKEFDDILQTASTTTWKNSFGENISYDDRFLSQSLYSDESFKLFIEELDSAFTLVKTSSTFQSLGYENVVHVGEYLVPFDFEEILENLFGKYGDFGAKCACSRELKQYLFVGLCKALQSMCKIKVAHVTKSMLLELWVWVAIGKAAGFEIQFVLEMFVRVVYAYFGFEADKYADEELTQIGKKVREVPEEVKELRRKLAEKERELEEAITEEEVLRKATFRTKKSHLMKKCLTEAEDLACYSLGELLLPPSEEVEVCDST